MTAWQGLLALLGFGLYAGVPLAHPRAGAAVASIGHAPSIEARRRVDVDVGAPPPTTMAAPEVELRPVPVVIASPDHPPAAMAKPARRRKRKPRRTPSFDASDGRAILETGIRPAVVETAPAR